MRRSVCDFKMILRIEVKSEGKFEDQIFAKSDYCI